MQQVSDVISCCCIKNGTTVVNTTFDKNVFFSSEKSTATIQIDNSNSPLPIKSVNYMIFQRIRLHGVNKEGDCCNKAAQFTYVPYKATNNESIQGLTNSKPF